MRSRAHTPLELTGAALAEGQVPPLLTIAETAAAVGLNSETLRRWCRQGFVPHVKISRQFKIPSTWLTQLVRQAEQSTG